MYKFAIAWLICLIVTTAILSSCTYMEPYILDIYDFLGWDVDNPLEESVEFIGEEALEHYTGIELDIDLTPSSPEG